MPLPISMWPGELQASDVLLETKRNPKRQIETMMLFISLLHKAGSYSNKSQARKSAAGQSQNNLTDIL